MLKRDLATFLAGIVLGGLSLSFSPGYDHSSRDIPQDIRPGISDESNDYQEQGRQASGREEIAYLDERDQDIRERAYRKGDWGYKQNWRYDREAFYRGETQGEVFDREHPDNVGGIGRDPDPEYLQMRRYYLEESRRNRQASATANRQNSYANPNNSSTLGNGRKDSSHSSYSYPGNSAGYANGQPYGQSNARNDRRSDYGDVSYQGSQQDYPYDYQ